VVLLRFLRERYEASELFAGHQASKIVPASDAHAGDDEGGPRPPTEP
jgi:hypothetical protein